MPAGRKRKHPAPDRYPRIDSYSSDLEIQDRLEEYTEDASYIWYNMEWEGVYTPIPGYRRYFLCPKCGRRCRYLYLVGDYYSDREVQCSKCAGIGYGASKRSKYYNQPKWNQFDELEEDEPEEHEKSHNRQIKAYTQMANWLAFRHFIMTTPPFDDFIFNYLQQKVHPLNTPFQTVGDAPTLADYLFLEQLIQETQPLEDNVIRYAEFVIVNNTPNTASEVSPELEAELKEGLYDLPFCDWWNYFLSYGYVFASFDHGKIKLIKKR